MPPLFSIIIPVHNVAPWLRECLDSVKNQTYANWEAICVDDGSTDESATILDKFAAMDDRFHVIHKVNGGVGTARNAALDVAKGDWIVFVDGDDIIWKGSLAKLHGIISRHGNIEIIAYRTLSFDDGKCYDFPKNVEESPLRVDLSTRIPDCKWCSFFGGKSYRRDTISDIRFKSYVRGEDLVFLVSCLCRVSCAVDSSYIVYGYRQRARSATHSRPSVQSVRDRMMASCDVLKTLICSGKRFPIKVYRTHISRLLVVHTRCILSVNIKEQLGLWCTWAKSLVWIALCFIGMLIGKRTYAL